MFGQFLGACVLLGILLLDNVHCVSLDINPSSVTIDADSGITSPEVTVECRPQYTSGIQQTFYIYLLRNNISFAEVVVTIENNQPYIVQQAPSDIRNNPPILEGGIYPSNPASSFIRARFNTSLIGCQGEASYQCQLSYKPSNGGTVTEFISRNLTVQVVPGNLNISASRFVVGLTNTVANLSSFGTDQELTLTCTGSTGKLQSTAIKWYWKYLNLFNFVEFTPNPFEGSTIDEGQTTFTCPYSRTSTLRLRVLSTMSSLMMFRCQTTPVSTINNFNYIAYSEEFHIYHDNRINGGLRTSVNCVYSILLPVVAFFKNHLP